MANKHTKNEFDAFLECCSFAASKKELAVFFDVFLTLSEKVELANRLKIIQALLEGERTQREIARDFKVSIANVSRGSNVLKSMDYDLNKLLNIKRGE